jgi:hypothetical protein
MQKRGSLIFVYAFMAITAIVGGSYLYVTKNKTTVQEVRAVQTAPEPGEKKIDLSPANPQDNADIEKKKQEAGMAGSPTPQTESPLSLIISRTSQDESGALNTVVLVNSVDATCTLTLINGTQKIVKSTVSKRENTTIVCAPLSITKNELPQSGTYEMSVTVSKGTAQKTESTKVVIVK